MRIGLADARYNDTATSAVVPPAARPCARDPAILRLLNSLRSHTTRTSERPAKGGTHNRGDAPIIDNRGYMNTLEFKVFKKTLKVNDVRKLYWATFETETITINQITKTGCEVTSDKEGNVDYSFESVFTHRYPSKYSYPHKRKKRRDYGPIINNKSTKENN